MKFPFPARISPPVVSYAPYPPEQAAMILLRATLIATHELSSGRPNLKSTLIWQELCTLVVGRAYGSVPASPPLWKVLGSIRFGSWAAARAQSLNLARRWSVPLASKHVYQLSTALALRLEVAGLLSRLLAEDDGSDKVGSVRQQAPRSVTMSKGYSLDKVAGRILLTLVDVAVWKSTIFRLPLHVLHQKYLTGCSPRSPSCPDSASKCAAREQRTTIRPTSCTRFRGQAHGPRSSGYRLKTKSIGQAPISRSLRWSGQSDSLCHRDERSISSPRR